ncbi:MAG TPA: hypothetical protein VD968_09605 [Pyrinomonadaceae bacterium]|nr:hypothetical protein [Pyrinomonadaceae bacterium]
MLKLKEVKFNIEVFAASFGFRKGAAKKAVKPGVCRVANLSPYRNMIATKGGQPARIILLS